MVISRYTFLNRKVVNQQRQYGYKYRTLSPECQIARIALIRDYLAIFIFFCAAGASETSIHERAVQARPSYAFLVPRTRYQVLPGTTRYQVPRTTYQVLGTTYQVPSVKFRRTLKTYDFAYIDFLRSSKSPFVAWPLLRPNWNLASKNQPTR